MHTKSSSIEFGNVIDLNIPHEFPPFLRSASPTEYISVYIYKEAYDGIKRHIRDDRMHERGGILVGHPFINIENKQSKFVCIKGQIPTESHNFSVGHFNVSPEELSRARNKMEEQFPGLIAVGWYHSHPGHGVFLSGPDMQIVKSIYNADWQLAFVVDSLQNKEAFFRGSEGVQIKNFEILNAIPACILAIEKYNQAQSKQQDGDRNALNEFRVWFIKNMVSSKELAHWFKHGKYQDLALNENVGMNSFDATNSGTRKQEVEKLISEAIQYITDNNLESLFSTINKIHQLVLDKQNAEQMKSIMITVQSRLAGNNWSPRENIRKQNIDKRV